MTGRWSDPVSPWSVAVVVPSPWYGVSEEFEAGLSRVPDEFVHQAVARAFVAWHSWSARSPVGALWTVGPEVRVEISRDAPDLFTRDRAVIVARLSPSLVRGELRKLLGTGVDAPSPLG